MSDGDSGRDADRPSDCKDSKYSSADPRLYALGYGVCIAESLETDFFDLGRFRLLFKHGFSLGERALYHQDEPAPNAGRHGYQGTFLELD